MIKLTLRSAAAAAMLAAAPMLSAALNTGVGGAVMSPVKTIVENASASKDHTTLFAAVTAAGLAETLSGASPFTVFAPTNAAFAKRPAGMVDTLLLPENKPRLKSILTYHVVPAALTSKDLAKAIRQGKGTAKLTTVQGATLRAQSAGGVLILTDSRGGTSMVAIKDVVQSNGVVHVVDTVLMP